MHDLITKLHDKFSLKNLGTPKYFLGIGVIYQLGSMILTQTKYIKGILTKVNMPDANGVNTTSFSHCKLSKQGTYAVDPTLYMSIVRDLQYVILTRLDISYSVNKAYEFMSNPLETHWIVVKRILWYLSGTTNHGLKFSPINLLQKFSLRAYSDADWATDLDDSGSTSRSYVYFGPNIVFWRSKKQPLVEWSSTAVEHQALAHTTSKLL